jgi:HEPN domain-containing protein
MRIEPDDYLEAAKDRLNDAQRLYDDKRYSFSLYAAGLAVESMLRAYRTRLNPEFEERHDLELLLAGSNLEKFVSSSELTAISAAVAIIFRRWKNDLRFASENRLRRHLKKQKLDRKIQGNYVKENCRTSIEAAPRVIKIGVQTWPQR